MASLSAPPPSIRSRSACRFSSDRILSVPMITRSTVSSIRSLCSGPRPASMRGTSSLARPSTVRSTPGDGPSSLSDSISRRSSPKNSAIRRRTAGSISDAATRNLDDLPPEAAVRPASRPDLVIPVPLAALGRVRGRQSVAGLVEQKPCQQARVFAGRPGAVLASVRLQSALDCVPGLSIDDGGMLTGMASALVIDLADVDRVREIL